MSRSKLAALLASLALTFSGATMVLATGQSVDICHASDSETNPYIAESPAIDSSGFLHGGHDTHLGPVWFPGAKDADVTWGDIIPPYDFGDFHFPGLNWTEEGQAILKNDCVAGAGINVEKTPSVDSLPDGGGEVTYTYDVTNTEQLVLSNVTVSDDKCSPVTYQSGDANSDNKLDLTETWTFTCTTTITETTVNTATATGHAGNETVTDKDQATVTVLPPEDNPAVSIDKTADPTSVPADGGDVTYTYVVTNTGNVSIFDINVRDDNGTPATGDDFDVTCPHDTLAAGDSMTCTADLHITADTTNVATVTANWDSCHDGCSTAVTPDTDDATVTVAQPEGNPSVSIDKTADPTSVANTGGDVTYTYVVTNTGNVSIFDINVRDDNGTADTGDDFDVTCPHDTLAAGDSMTCTADLHITVSTTNVATVTANWDSCNDGCSTAVTPDTDDATVEVAPPGRTTPIIHVVKTPSVTDLPAGGGDVTYTYVVTNEGDVALTDVTANDNKCSPLALVSGDTNSDSILDLTETWTYTCTATLTETTTNTVIATGHGGDTTVFDTDEATVTVAPAPGTPGINVAKTPSVTTLPSVGGDVTYTYVVTNTGSVPLTTVSVTDDKCAPVDFVSGDTNSDSILDVSETWTYTCTATLTATTTNTALATGHDGDTEVTDTDQATVTVAPPEGGVGGETSPPKVTQPPTDTIATATTSGTGNNTLPYLLIVLGIIGFGAVLLTPTRPRR